MVMTLWNNGAGCGGPLLKKEKEGRSKRSFGISCGVGMLLMVLGMLVLPERSLQAQGGGTVETDTNEVLVIEAESEEPSSGEFKMTKSPTAALLWAIIPSAGQVYTEQYWKVPIFLIPIGGLVGLGIYNNNRAQEYADQLALLDPNTTEYRIAQTNRNNFRDNRDLSWAIAGGVYLLSFIDAYVGAHLFDFDVDDELGGIQVYPDFGRNGVGVSARW